MDVSNKQLQILTLKAKPDYSAPDGSEIRLLPAVNGGGLCHCTLPAGKVSSPIAHRQVEEIWYVIEGNGEIWRKLDDQEQTVPLSPGSSISIPPQTSFQFRNVSKASLCIIIATMPPWPGPDEAYAVEGLWMV